MSPDDKYSVMHLLPTGCFGELHGELRTAALVVCIELERQITVDGHQRRFERYHPEQPLFAEFPEYFAQVYGEDLLPSRLVVSSRSDGIFQQAGKNLRIDPYLHPSIVAMARIQFRGSPIFLRIDPYFVRDDVPPPQVLESILTPADPGWWSSLNLYPGNRTGAAYQLDPSENPRDDLRAYSEFHFRHVRRLEMQARRSESDYLSMMLEELSDYRERDGYVVGRMIHWDTHAPQGTAIDAAELKHIDLAMNFYLGADADQRMSQSLSVGRIQDASSRTHLLRVDGVESKAILLLAQLFMVSESLFCEWLDDQFGKHPIR